MIMMTLNHLLIQMSIIITAEKSRNLIMLKSTYWFDTGTFHWL